VIVNKRYQ